MAIQRCPNDGESLGWHLFVHDVNGDGRLLTNGDMIGCDFGKDDIKEHDRESNRAMEESK